MFAPTPKTTIIGGKPLWYSPLHKYVCSMLLQALIAIPCLSQTIGNWTFNNILSGTGGTHNTASPAAFSAGIPSVAYNGGTEYFGESGWPSGVINTGNYLQFSISPNSGYQLDLTDIVLRIRRSNTGSPAGSGPTQWSLRSSLDGYTSDITSNNLTHNYSNYTVTLNSSFLNVFTTVTFRLYGYSTSLGSGGTSRLVVDNISIQGIGSVLPLSITGIQTLRSNDKNVSVKWQVNNVQEGSVFNVERSLNGIDFTTVNRFTERDNKSTSAYSYEDNQAPGNVPAVFYRIKINEPNGWTYFSWLVKVNTQTIQQLSIDYATTQGQSLVTSLQIPEKGMYSVSVLSMHGAVLQQRSLDLDAGVHVLTLPLNAMAHGTYVVRLTGNRQLSSKKVVW